MSTYPESLTNSAERVPTGVDPLAFAVVHAAIEELRECLKMLHHCVSQLSPGQIWSRPDEDQNAIGNLILHLAGNLRQWVVVGLSEAADSRNRAAEFAERRQIPATDLLLRSDRCVNDAITALNLTTIPAELLKLRRIQGFEVHGVAAIQHAVSHFRGHTQEIIGRTRQLLGKNYQFAWFPNNDEQGCTTHSPDRAGAARPMNLLDRLLEHDAWTTRELLELCRDFSEEQLDRDFDIGHRTVRATFEHLIRNMEIWSQLMARKAVEPTQAARHERCSIVAMIDRLDQAAKNLADVSRAVADRDGWDERWIDSLDGKEKTYGGSIAHVITHSMHHRAQLLYLLRRLGIKNLPEGDVLSWEQQARRANEPFTPIEVGTDRLGVDSAALDL